jgi:hypothetical protein
MADHIYWTVPSRYNAPRLTIGSIGKISNGIHIKKTSEWRPAHPIYAVQIDTVLARAQATGSGKFLPLYLFPNVSPTPTRIQDELI